MTPYPTIIEAVGEPVAPQDKTLPGKSLLAIAKAVEPDRTILSEYHAVGSTTGIFMVRFGKWKYIHYEGERPQLFDLESDPGETRDLALVKGNEAALAEGKRRLYAICDPAKVNTQAFADQQVLIDEHGGEAKVLGMGSYPYTPAPGETPRYQ